MDALRRANLEVRERVEREPYVLFGHFEEHKPKARRVLKVALVALITVVLSMYGLRWVAFTLLGLLALAAAYVHGVWLPKHGINGWTGEPKDRYYDLLKVPEERRPRPLRSSGPTAN
jgi:hypothetical protein